MEQSAAAAQTPGESTTKGWLWQMLTLCQFFLYYDASFARRYRSVQEDPLWRGCVCVCVIVSLIRLAAESVASKIE